VLTKVDLPTPDEMEEAKISSRTLSKYADVERVTVKVPQSDETYEDLILPGMAIDLLLNILTEMGNGNAVTIMPLHAVLTTQEAANILNVSRPFLVKLLEEGEIDFEKVGKHRRIKAQDLLAYQQASKQQQLEALNELAALGQELGI